ncbi:L-rhamnose/proton symporter RhaT [Parasediminibacterium sp. JCM 36343]|uniref:L-rhamnose/proton symporter RhaT n=1 Tax=Parasediminibacterium sp. JCM 36343 TaxID=3374279 RepID=UPI00397E2DE1
MEITIGLLILLVAGFFQGSFVLPMTMTKQWNWENTWLTFSLLGMVVLNLVLAFLFIPHLFDVYRSVPVGDLLLLMLFGLCWGFGAVLFGIAMARLGMALGYPIIMGLIASFGAVIPMLVFHSNEVATLKGGTLILGSVIVVAGIMLCAQAHVLKENPGNNSQKSTSGIFVAVAAGILSCLPNIGFSFGKSIVSEALLQGSSSFMAGNAVWALFFTMGFVPNAVYTFYLLTKNKSFGQFKFSTARNIFMGFLMAAMWIGSFYLYGISSIKLGAWGSIIGWPLFISLSIIIGNLWGIAKSEWQGASQKSKTRLNQGLAVIFLAVVVIGLCNLL